MPVELIWDGKYDPSGKRVQPVRLALPFQTIETINESAQQRQPSQTGHLRAPAADFDWVKLSSPRSTRSVPQPRLEEALWNTADQLRGHMERLSGAMSGGCGKSYAYAASPGEASVVRYFLSPLHRQPGVTWLHDGLFIGPPLASGAARAEATDAGGAGIQCDPGPEQERDLVETLWVIE